MLLFTFEYSWGIKKNNILARWRAFNKGLSSQNQFAGANKKLSIPTEKGEFTLN